MGVLALKNCFTADARHRALVAAKRSEDGRRAIITAAVNAPQSRRFAKFEDARLSRSVWSAVASAPLSGRNYGNHHSPRPRWINNPMSRNT